MTSAYYQDIGKATFAPVDTTKAAGAIITADYTDSQKQITERNISNLNNEFARIGQEYMQMYKDYSSGKAVTDLLNLTTQGIVTKKRLENFAETRKMISQFETHLKSAENLKLYLNGATYADLSLTDPDVQKTVKAEQEIALQRQALHDANKEERDSGRPGSEFQPVDWGLFQDTLGNENATEVTRNFTHYWEWARKGLKVQVEPGQPAITWDEAGSAEHRKIIAAAITLSYAHANKDILGDPGRLKRDFLSHALTVRDNKLNEANKEEATFLAAAEERESLRDLAYKLKTQGPSAAIDYINIYKGKYDGSYTIARQKMAQKIHDAAAIGELTEGDVDKIIDHKFTAHDGSTPTIGKYWPKEAKLMRKGVRTYQKGLADEATENLEASRRADAVQTAAGLEKQDGPITIEQKNQAISEWMAKHGVTDSRLVPAVLQNIRYAGIEDDAELDRIFTHNAANGIPISEKEIMSFKDPNYKLKWRKQLKALGTQTSDRSKFIRSAVDGHFNNKLGEAGRGTTDYYYTEAAATSTYEKEYNRILEETGSHAQATSAAQKAVSDLLAQDQAGKIDLTQRADIPVDTTVATNINAAAAALSKDPTLISSDKPLPGEAPYIKQAVDYINGRGKVRPHFYDKLAPGINKTHPEQLMRDRLEAMGLLKKGEAALPEKGILSEAELRKTRFSSPSATFQVTQENPKTLEMLKIVEDETAQSGAKYDHVRDKNGEIVSLTKPLSQHTIGELIDLIGQGYEDFGLYGISNGQLRDILQNVPVDINELFDQENQDALVLARLRQKAQVAQRYCTIDDTYRHTVTLDKLTRNEFYSIVGDLPPYLQIENMLPACSKELVEQTLQ